MEERKQQRICVVGSGMAGLVAAYTLQKDRSSRFAVDVIEAVRILLLLVISPAEIDII